MSSSAPLPLKDRCVLPPCGWQERQRGGGGEEERCGSAARPTGRAAGAARRQQQGHDALATRSSAATAPAAAPHSAARPPAPPPCSCPRSPRPPSCPRGGSPPACAPGPRCPLRQWRRRRRRGRAVSGVNTEAGGVQAANQRRRRCRRAGCSERWGRSCCVIKVWKHRPPARGGLHTAPISESSCPASRSSSAARVQCSAQQQSRMHASTAAQQRAAAVLPGPQSSQRLAPQPAGQPATLAAHPSRC